MVGKIIWFALLLVNYVLAHGGGQKAKWAYNQKDGLPPYSWKRISEYCDNQNYMQSPINIDTTQLSVSSPSVCTPNNQLDWNLKGANRDVIAVNNGHSLTLTVIKKGSNNVDNVVKLNSEKDQIGELSNFFNINMNVEEHHDFCLDSFHFHWGRNDKAGSEHTINNHQYPLEAHFVHYSCDFDNLKDALSKWEEYGNQGKDIFVLGVVGIFFKIGAPNPELNKIFQKYKQLENTGNKAIVKNVNLNGLTPKNTAYYTYDGSLTTPPCTPVVKWHVVAEAMTVSEQQLTELRALLNAQKGPEGPNYRPLETNSNPVYGCI